MTPSADTPLQRATFPAARLMAEHPPQLRHPGKQIVFDVACPAGCEHAGALEYTRWPAFALPAQVTPADAVERVIVHEDIYQYARPATGVVEWHVNFADPQLFVAHAGPLFAQDEMQVAEHPALAALVLALREMKWPTLTVEKGKPTPVLVKGVERRCRIAIDAKATEGRPDGLYGNAFMLAKGDAVRRATTRLEPPTLTNLIVIAAPNGMYGAYARREVEVILATAYTGFRASVLESGGAPVVVHTGYWGCGAFGGNRVMMSMLQVLAAGMAGVERLVFHTVTPSGRAPFDAAMARIWAELPAVATDVSAVTDALVAMGLRWGASNGT